MNPFKTVWRALFSGSVKGNVDDIDAYLLSMESSAHFMGTVLIQYKDQALFCKGYGDASRGSKNSSTTLFQIASVTKQFTAAACMKLYEEHLIDLQGPVNQYLPQKCRCKRWNDIEVRHLLSHRSGVSDYCDRDDYWKVCKHLTPDKVIEEAKEEKLAFSPGTDFLYSNTGYQLLGKIIEEASQMDYGDFIVKNILLPAGMTSSGILKGGKPPVPNAAVGHCIENLKLVEDLRNEYSVIYADGAMYSTVGDMAKWSAVLDGKNNVLRPESIKLMIAHEYGLMVDKLFGRKRIHHNGSMAGFNADFCKFPEEELTIIILGNNVDFSVDYLTARIAAYLLEHKPFVKVVPLPDHFNFSPYLKTFYWEDDEDDEDDDEDENDDDDDADEDEDDEDEDSYTFKRSQNHLVLDDDNPIECHLLSNGRLFNATEGEEFQLQRDGGIVVYNCDGEEEGLIYPD